MTGRDLLARCLVPVDSPHAPAIFGEEYTRAYDLLWRTTDDHARHYGVIQ